MSSNHEIRIALERDYRLAWGEYERAEQPAEQAVGLKENDEDCNRIKARNKVLKEKVERLDYMLRLQVNPESTPHQLTPLHPRKTLRKGTIAKAAYQAPRRSSEPMTMREISETIAGALQIDATDQRAVNQLDSAVRTSMKERVAEIDLL